MKTKTHYEIEHDYGAKWSRYCDFYDDDWITIRAAKTFLQQLKIKHPGVNFRIVRVTTKREVVR